MNVWNTNRFSDSLDYRRHPGPVFDHYRAYISNCKFIEHYKNEILKLNMKFFLLLLKNNNNKEFFSNMYTSLVVNIRFS